METSVHELARLTQEDVEQTLLTTRAYIARHRKALVQALEEMGFEEVKFTRFAAKTPFRPEITAVARGREACICFAEMPKLPLDLDGLSEEQVDYCDEFYAGSDVYYACLLMNPHAKLLHLLGPVPVRLDGIWQAQDPERNQYIPLARRRDMDRYSAIYGGAALFKMDKLLAPHVMEHGTLPRFTVEKLFADQAQGDNGYYAVMSGQTPTHLMLVQQGEDGATTFRRPFFFGNSNPVAELELMRCLDAQPDCGVTELMDRTGRVLYAECLEATLFPARLPAGKHYKWTLSLVANEYRRMKADDATAEELGFYQEPYDTYTQLCAEIARVDEVQIDGRPAYVWTLHPLQHNAEVEVQAYVGAPLVKASHRPQPVAGDVVELGGFLYASPDELVETTESWQDSGEVAAMQETQQLETQGKQARRSHAPYSLAHAALAAAFAMAGYVDLRARISHTRQDPTFAVRNEQGYTALLFLDVQIGDTPPQFPYTKEQMARIVEREKKTLGPELKGHHCLVRLVRREDKFVTSLHIEPACPGVPADIESVSIAMAGEDDSLSEARACRILSTAICRQAWGSFAAIAGEDLTYTSLINGTKTLGKVEYIRYMAERKPLWESQQAWPGVSIDTGTIEYVGRRRPCFMISCYGRMVGAAVVTLSEGRVADIVTLPLEANDTFEKDAESSAAPVIFHPMRGHLTAYSQEPSPLQRFTTAYLQDCMIRHMGFCGATGSPADVYISDGVEHKVAEVGARWAKLVRNEPSFCDMAFTCAGRMYAVCAVEVPAHPENGGDMRDIIMNMVPEREQALRMAEQHRLIPCVFPVQRDHTPLPQKTWNLWDMRTMEPVTPTMGTGEEDAPLSEWEVLYAALAEVEHMLSVGGCEIVACHDMPDTLPHVWFRDPHGQLSWIIIRPHTSVAYADRGPSEAELQAARLTDGAPGYVVDAEPYRDRDYTKPATTREQLRFVKITMPLPLS